MIDLPTLIAERMDALGVTKYRLAQMSGVSQTTIGKFLAGTRRMNHEDVSAVIDALGGRVVFSRHRSTSPPP